MAHLKLAVAALLLASAVTPADAGSAQRAERLVGVALVTEWVAANCGTEKLSPMLLLTTPPVLKQLDPDKLKLGRRRVADRAARFPSRAKACEDWIGDLVAIQ